MKAKVNKTSIKISEIWSEAHYDELVCMADASDSDHHFDEDGCVHITSNLQQFINEWNK